MARGVVLPKSAKDDGADFRNSPEYAARLRTVLSRHMQKLLRDRGWTQSELVRKANAAMPKGAVKITRDNISRYIQKDNFPGPERIEAIRRAFNVKMEDLLPESEWLTEHEYLSLKKQKKWDVSMTTSGKDCFLHVDAQVPFPVAAQIMELLQKHAPANIEETVDDED